jgi:hypothetical protein
VAKRFPNVFGLKKRFIELIRLADPAFTHLDWAKIGYNSEKSFNNVELINKTT